MQIYPGCQDFKIILNNLQKLDQSKYNIDLNLWYCYLTESYNVMLILTQKSALLLIFTCTQDNNHRLQLSIRPYTFLWQRLYS